MRYFVLLFAFLALLSVSRADFGCAWYSPISKGKKGANEEEDVLDFGTVFPPTTSISWPDGSGVCSGSSDYYSWANAKNGKASTLIHEHYGPTITGDAGLITFSAQTGDAVPTGEAFSPSEIPSNAGEPLGVPNTQSLTSTFSIDGALASLMHYKSNDQLVGIFCLFVAGLAGAGAILL